MIPFINEVQGQPKLIYSGKMRTVTGKGTKLGRNSKI